MTSQSFYFTCMYMYDVVIVKHWTKNVWKRKMLRTLQAEPFLTCTCMLCLLSAHKRVKEALFAGWMLSNSSNIIQIVKFVFFYMYMHVTVINKSTVMFPVYKAKDVIAWFLKA